MVIIISSFRLVGKDYTFSRYKDEFNSHKEQKKRYSLSSSMVEQKIENFYVNDSNSFLDSLIL